MTFNREASHFCFLPNLIDRVEMSEFFSDFDIEPYMDDNQIAIQEAEREAARIDLITMIRRGILWPGIIPRKEYLDRCRLPFRHELEARRMKQYAVFVEVLKFAIKTRFINANIPDRQTLPLTNIVVRQLYTFFIKVGSLTTDSCGLGLSAGDCQTYRFEAYASCVEVMNASITMLCGRMLSKDGQESVNYAGLLKDVHDFIVDVVVLFDENPIG